MTQYNHSSNNPEELKTQFLVSDSDLDLVRSAAPKLEARLPELLTRFYDWMETRPEFAQFFSDAELLESAQARQVEFWRQLFTAEIDEAYVATRFRVGQTHARIGLQLSSYWSGVNTFLEIICQLLTQELPQEEVVAVQGAITKVAHLDAAIIVDSYNAVVEDMLTSQSKALMEMSTPVTQIWEGILLLPIVGIIDSHRAGDIMNATLAKIAETQAQIFILDISGVGVVDTAVANNLIKITSATRLMGCECTISGLSPAIAQTIVDLGIDVGSIKTTATMKDALSDAFQRSGMEISTKRVKR
ncbi:MAG: protoglobin domain-containing protein [Planctomycetota bacterium]|jgi:rsbT co-antagonist protein RsbR